MQESGKSERESGLPPGSNPLSGSLFSQIMKDSVQIPNKLPAWSIQEGKGNLEIRFRHGGKFRALSSGTRSRREAENRAPGLLSRWLAARGQEAPQTAWADVVRAFREQEYADNKVTTWEEVAGVLRRLAAAFPEGPRAVTPKSFREGLKAYRGRASAKYWANILSITRRFCRWAASQGLMASDATHGLPYPDKGQFGRREGIWADEYFDAVFVALQKADQERIMIMRWTGMDSGDLFHFDPKKHLSKDEAGHLVLKKRREKAKSDEETIVQPLSPRVAPLMGRKHGEGFVSMRSFTASLLGRVQRAMSAAGLPARDLKSLRHTFATYHAERGVPLDVLRTWLGHARTSRTLDRYYIHRRSTARYMD
jgi:integrase